MIVHADTQLASTRDKLRRLEERYQILINDEAEDEHVRELTLRSLKKYINQFKEEIARIEILHDARPAKRRVLIGVELANTRRKLAELERAYEEDECDTGCEDGELRQVSKMSLKKIINQLKEEIIWTELHQPAERR